MAPSLREALKERVLVLDGAMGTSIHAANPDLERDFLGLENCSEILCATRPDIIGRIHESFLAVGCDVVETNTFGANKLVLAEFGIAERTHELNVAAARIARAAADKFATRQKPRWVLGSMGPGTKLPTLGHTEYAILRDSYHSQARGLIEGGVDGFLIETCQDPLQIKSALAAVNQAKPGSISRSSSASRWRSPARCWSAPRWRRRSRCSTPSTST
jgi:5-methyltetrahydrofolate--homocysteine methyltransferase